MSKKKTRIQVELSETDHSLISYAAKHLGMTLEQFMEDAVKEHFRRQSGKAVKKLSDEMQRALVDMFRFGVRTPSQTGIYRTTYEALVDRDLAIKWFKGSYRLTAMGKGEAQDIIE